MNLCRTPPPPSLKYVSGAPGVLCTIFRRVTNLKLNSYLTVAGSFTLLSPTLVNANKAMKSGTLLSQVASRTKQHDVESTDMHWILTTNKNICTGENTTRRKNCPIFASADVFQLPSRRISRRWTRSETNVVIFLQALCAQTNLFWREMKKMYLKSNTRQENFRTLEERNVLNKMKSD